MERLNVVMGVWHNCDVVVVWRGGRGCGSETLR